MNGHGMTDVDERRVRTVAGWIGVEISKSRVRMPDRAGYGLYRVRGSIVTRIGAWQDNGGVVQMLWDEWTGYLFELEAVRLALDVAISQGTPAGPAGLVLYHPNPKQGRDRPAILVPTRWTSAYRGPRNGAVREAARALGPSLTSPADPYRVDPTDAVVFRLPVGAGVPGTVRTRRRAANAAFQAEHKLRRDAGLEARHAAKLSRAQRQE